MRAKPLERVPEDHLCVFLATGRTYTFHGVEIESDNETALTFYYRAMSDGRKKRAEFYKSQLAGVSRWRTGEDK